MRADSKLDQINNVPQVFIGSILVLLSYEVHLVLTEPLVYSFHRLYLAADKVIGHGGQGKWLFTLTFLLGKRRVTPTRLAETGVTLISSLEGIIAQLQMLTGLFIIGLRSLQLHTCENSQYSALITNRLCRDG